jgi:hypothetical protein
VIEAAGTVLHYLPKKAHLRKVVERSIPRLPCRIGALLLLTAFSTQECACRHAGYYPLSLIRESEMMQKAEIRESVSILSLTARISDSGYYAST